jgi:D-arabinose 1-dehydrogenase-like Zn-dependent alcohol dehydrogenase
VASPELPINVFPFILRGISLVGIDSQNCPMPKRLKTWGKLADEWKISMMETVVKEITLSDLDQAIDRMLQGKHKGRAIVNMTA